MKNEECAKSFSSKETWGISIRIGLIENKRLKWKLMFRLNDFFVAYNWFRFYFSYKIFFYGI